jgi:methionyl-tRNA formyltransferase
MRILFVGSVEFSAACLESVLAQGGDVVGIINPGQSTAKINADYCDLFSIAVTHNIPLHRVNKIGDEASYNFIRDVKPDIMFVFGFSQLIGQKIMDLLSLGAIGAHPTLLPEGRGRHPIIWTLVKGLKKSGLTFFYIDEGTDTGDILWQRSFVIDDEDNATSLYKKIVEMANDAITDFLPALASGEAMRVPQDNDRATQWQKRSKRDGEIIWDKPAETIFNTVRALAHPYPGAHTYLGDVEISIWQARIASNDHEYLTSRPGTVVSKTNNVVSVKCGDGIIELLAWTSQREIDFNQGACFVWSKS